jgi:hypothetical protein
MAQLPRSAARTLLTATRYDALSFALRRLRVKRAPAGEPTALDLRFINNYGATVRAGPFAGLSYDPRVVGHTTAVAAKLMGAYECELHPAVARLLSSDMSVFVDIGCAEGYYAVGVAMRRPDVRVVAFDIDATARHMCRLMARRNHVSIEIREEATPTYLANLVPRTVIFSDCEGAEAALLDPGRSPLLRQLKIIVEVHDFVDPNVTQLLRSRFASSHTLHEVITAPRDATAYPELAVFSESDRLLALAEGRPGPMSWLIMTPR